MRYKANFPVYELHEILEYPEDTEVMLYQDVLDQMRNIIKAHERLEFDGMEYEFTESKQNTEEE